MIREDIVWRLCMYSEVQIFCTPTFPEQHLARHMATFLWKCIIAFYKHYNYFLMSTLILIPDLSDIMSTDLTSNPLFFKFTMNSNVLEQQCTISSKYAHTIIQQNVLHNNGKIETTHFKTHTCNFNTSPSPFHFTLAIRKMIINPSTASNKLNPSSKTPQSHQWPRLKSTYPRLPKLHLYPKA